MALIRKLLALPLQPAITIPLLLALTNGPPNLREPLVDVLSKYFTAESIERLITVLKFLAVGGCLKTFNARLNQWALNNWRWSTDVNKWKWPREVAIVTGGCSGIGLHMVKQLCAKGVKVAVFDIQPAPKELGALPNMAYFECDVTDPASISNAAHQLRLKWGDPSILINNAGIGKPQPIVDTPNEFVTKIFQINIISHFFLIKEFLPAMLKKDKGHIVGIASMASWVAPPGIVNYAATKAGVMALWEGLNQELKHIYKSKGVLNTVAHPHWTRTPLVGGHEDHLEKTQGKLLTPEAVAKKVVDQIISCRGGQLFMPGHMSIAARLRGEANWLQEVIRDFAVGGAALQH